MWVRNTSAISKTRRRRRKKEKKIKISNDLLSTDKLASCLPSIRLLSSPVTVQAGEINGKNVQTNFIESKFGPFVTAIQNEKTYRWGLQNTL